MSARGWEDKLKTMRKLEQEEIEDSDPMDTLYRFRILRHTGILIKPYAYFSPDWESIKPIILSVADNLAKLKNLGIIEGEAK